MAIAVVLYPRNLHGRAGVLQVAAGNLRQQLGDNPTWTEARLVLRSVNDINLPKFTVEDLPLFKGITSDLFPGVELGESDHGLLMQSIDTVCEEGITILPGQALKLVPKPSWKKKVVQLYEMVLVRHGVMIVGQAGSGKTATVHTLANAMSRCCEDGAMDFNRVQVIRFCRLISLCSSSHGMRVSPKMHKAMIALNNCFTW